MKFLSFLIVSVFFITTYSSAQDKNSQTTSLRNNLEKVLSGYANGFNDLRGEILVENPQSIDFASLVKPEGSLEAVITQYSHKNNAIYSWQSVMFSSEEFDEASKKYKTLFTQVKGMTLRLNNDYTFSLKGSFDAPEDGKEFFSSILTLLPAGNPLQKLKIEVSMQYEFPEWKVALLVYEREREDDERGKTKD